ncbi:glycosyltransferase [Sagittula salina]|uniref:Glycosyltransferase n=1 Tax=Sagittula salina TaxID=2820268 RepID=A0A940S2W3_9RHOB|nr:glycosyltransferase [Sagittula salina]MBP0484491.1 glycosyltransferase [Sagittula salina]
MYHRARRLFALYAAWHLPADRLARRHDRLRLLPGFLWRATRCLPQALRWVRHRDPVARARVKQVLGLHGRDTRFFDPRLFEPQLPARPPRGGGVTLVMPVYTPPGGNAALLQQALARVAQTDLTWRIVLVEDASPHADTRTFLRDWAARHPAHLIENTANLGFVGSVNRGLDLARTWDDPVVLLNSDALLPPDWAPRLLRPLWEDASVGSVTPLSNDAELASVPEAGAASPITPEAALAIDRIAAGLNARAWVPTPAGVGFCMALSRQALEVVPRFDEVFAPGYGEEVDWCQRTRAAGFSHVYTPALYVAHVGGQSFGSTRKQALIQRNSEVISRRYPGFDAEVQGFVKRDPLASARLALGLARAEVMRAGPLPVTLAHSMGGGAEIDLQRRLARDLQQVGAALVIRVGGPCRFLLELHGVRADGSAGVTAVQTADWADVVCLLAPVTRRALVYSCAVGDPDPVTLPGFFLALRRAGDSLTVLMHDYFPLSPNHILLEEGERWQGLPDPARASVRHTTHRPDGACVTLADWRAHWGRLLRAADEVTCFSAAAQALVTQTYPQAHCALRPHALPVPVPAVSRPSSGRPVLGLLGNLAPHKGARVAAVLGRACARSGAGAGLVLLGDLDPAYRLPATARHHGRYAVDDLAALTARYGITCWLIPSLWPETFSFTTHEALATGLPVMTFDLGGQAEALRAALAQGAPGALLPLDWADDPAALLSLAARLSDARQVA